MATADLKATMTMSNAQVALIAAATSIPGAEPRDVRALAQAYQQWLDSQDAAPGPVVVPKDEPAAGEPANKPLTATHPCGRCGKPIRLYGLASGPTRAQWMHVGEGYHTGGLFLHCDPYSPDVARPTRETLDALDAHLLVLAEPGEWTSGKA